MSSPSPPARWPDRPRDRGPAGGVDRALSVSEYRSLLKTECEKSERQARALGEPEEATPEAIADYFEKIADLSRKKQREFERP